MASRLNVDPLATSKVRTMRALSTATFPSTTTRPTVRTRPTVSAGARDWPGGSWAAAGAASRTSRPRRPRLATRLGPGNRAGRRYRLGLPGRCEVQTVLLAADAD